MHLPRTIASRARSKWRRWSIGAIVVTFMVGRVSVALALPSCSATISSCGCTITSAGVFKTSGDLASASASTDCIDISAAGAVLVLFGNLTGPGGAVTADGIHVLSGATNAFISGQTIPQVGAHALVTGFGTGIQVDASNAEISQLDASGNAANGVVFNNVTGGDYEDADADMNTGVGVLVTGGSGNLVDDNTLDGNKSGVVFSSSAMNRIADSEADSNSSYGFWFEQTTNSHAKDSGASKNMATGTYIGCFPSGGPTGQKCPKGASPSNFNRVLASGGSSNTGAGVAIDLGDSSNVVDSSAGAMNTTFDAVDKNKKCDHNIWLLDMFSKVSQSCIH